MTDGEFPVIVKSYPGGILVGFYNEKGEWVDIMSMTRSLLETGVSL